jgi:F-type H+-transporting ATPase subunit epsilon
VAELECEIVTPEGAVFSGKAAMVVVPGKEGGLGVLPRHAPIIAQLDAGEVRVKLADGSTRAFATSDGYFKMQYDRALVVVAGAEPAEKIDVEAARREAEDARERIAAADRGDDEIDRFRAERDLAYAENRLEVAGR